jgi:hypothetical protein
VSIDAGFVMTERTGSVGVWAESWQNGDVVVDVDTVSANGVGSAGILAGAGLGDVFVKSDWVIPAGAPCGAWKKAPTLVQAQRCCTHAESARSLTDLYWVESSHLTEESGQRPADVRQRLSTFPQGEYRGVESPWPDSRRCWKFNVGLAGPAWRRPRSGRHRRAQSHRR